MKTFTSLLAVISLIGAPATAGVREAALTTSSDRQITRTSLFVGATYRVGLDRRTGGQGGRASLRFAGMSRSSGSEIRFSQGLELKAGASSRPAVYLAGHDIGQLRTKSHLNGTTTAVIVGGVLLLGVIAAVAVSDYERDQRCIGEEGDCD